ncbi:hypothetical protein [Nocardioides sp. GXQ0305]|uniref:hypothetical protein n=1 Tax=Nocardioides sp. GXQ0305 TaxID=3423912 RepID=UPI003D7D3CDB
MSEYPQYPTEPGQQPGGPAYGAPAARGPRPTSVDTAVKLIWATIVLSLVSAVVTFVLIDTLIDQQLEASGVTLDEGSIRSIVLASAVFGLVISVGITALLAIFIGKGHNWARIVYTVLVAIGVLLSLFGIGSQPVLLLVLGLLSAVLSIAAVVFLFRSDANAWFKAR